MDSVKERNRLKRRRIQEMFKEPQEEKENAVFSNYSEKQQFFKMLNIFNKEKAGTKKEEEPVSVNTLQKEDIQRKEKFKIQFPSCSGTADNSKLPDGESYELILSINAAIMRSVLKAKWEKIFLEEGDLEDVLDWHSTPDLVDFELFPTDDVKFGDDWFISFDDFGEKDSFEF